MRSRTTEGGTFNGTLEFQNKSMFNKRFCNHVSPYSPKDCNYRVSNSRSKRGRGGNSLSEKPTFVKCGKKHLGDYIV